MSTNGIEKEARAHTMKTSSVDNRPRYVIIPPDVYKETLEAYNKSITEVDLEILDELAKIPTKEEKE